MSRGRVDSGVQAEGRSLADLRGAEGRAALRRPRVKDPGSVIPGVGAPCGTLPGAFGCA